MITDKQIIHAMIEHGGAFVSKLGEAALRADYDNLARIKAAFPDYWKKYTEIVEKSKEK